LPHGCRFDIGAVSEAGREEKMSVARRRLLQLSVVTALASLSRAGHAEAWPNRPVRLVVGFPAGGGMDLAARILSNRLSDIWGQPVVVENKPGAGSRLALDAVAHAAPDGYSMLIAAGAPEVNRLLFSTLTFDPVADFAPVSLVGTFPDIIAVSNASPFENLEDFLTYARRNPGKISWASPGVGTVPHLAGELFKRMAGIEMTHVPYRGITEGLMSDLIGGRIDLMFNTTGTLLQPVRSHQVRGLAVTSGSRFPNEPELPTVRESGLPGYDVSSWYALYVPAKTPPDIVQKMNADIVVMLREPEIKEKFEPLGIVAAGSSPAQLAGRNSADAALWGPLIKAADIKVE
jgi:tripartite-type tricarboxylate transporter receptor subunit TctC